MALDKRQAAPPATPPVVNLEERGWLPRHCRGDAAAFPALMGAYRRPVYSYLLRCGVGTADRDDLFQAIFLKIHSGARSYDPARPLAPWIFTIVANVVRNHFRDLASAASTPTPDGVSQELADPQPGPEQIARAREEVARLEAALKALPLAQREVLVMVTILARPQKEVAEALGIPLNTVKTQLRRARLALVKAMAASAPATSSTAASRPEGGSHDHL
ncbi:MAG TPA: RNA polymerase sigma factor [Kiloniellaceae bacterium]|nr:RNA polymerase sigma factor [Kiloniellaceae bacterium]